MRKVVLSIKEDTCQENGKDVNATELLKVMSHYGTVESFESAVAKEKAESQSIIDGLTKQLNAIKEQELTEDEMRVVKHYREVKATVVSGYTVEIEKYKGQLQAVKSEHEQRVAKLKAILGDE
jgi:DNA phosphorothioation-dependent restriction protein DptG